MGAYYSNKYIYFSVPTPGYVYMKVRGPQDQRYITSVSDLMLKDIHYNYFGFEIVHQDEANVFSGVKAGELKVAFDGSVPTISFKQASLQSVPDYKFDLKYKLLISLDKKMMKYFNSCGTFFASSFYPEHITRANFDRIFSTYTLTGAETDKDGWINVVQKVTGFTTYYTSVFAELTARSVGSGTSGDAGSIEDLRIQSHNYSMFKRIHYRILKYTTSDFAWPLELVTAVGGFVMLILVSIYLLKKSGPEWMKHITGFSQVAHDVNDALERNFEELKQRDESFFPVNAPAQVGTEGYEVEDNAPKAKAKKTQVKKPVVIKKSNEIKKEDGIKTVDAAGREEGIDEELEISIEEQIARTSKLFPTIKEPEPTSVKEIELTTVDQKKESSLDA